MPGGCSASPVFWTSAEGGLAPIAEVPHGIRIRTINEEKAGAAIVPGPRPRSRRGLRARQLSFWSFPS